MKNTVTKVFVTGRRQAVRIPKISFQLLKGVYIERKGETLVLRPKPRTWNDDSETGKHFSDDFPERIEDRAPEE